MGRGRSKAGGANRGAPAYSGNITIGMDNIEFDGSLQYGPKDGTFSSDVRRQIENWEAKRVKNKVEYAFAVGPDGQPLGNEVKGSKGSVRVPRYYHTTDGATFTHIHPREEGYLGGTFSDADLYNFADFGNATSRAAAKEGTYSISKTSKFDAGGFKSYVSTAQANFKKNSSTRHRKALDDLKNGKINMSEYSKAARKAFNTALIDLHNELLAGQKKYGYVYTLEQR